MAKADGVQSEAVKLTLAPTIGAAIANWNSGVATSGLAGADLVTLGAADTNYLVHSLIASIANLTPAAAITVRLYQLVNAVERQVYAVNFIQGTDPDGLWIVDGTLGIHQALRCEVYSNAGADDGAVIDYDYILELCL